MLEMEFIINYCKRFYIKAFHWEYWPMWAVYFPVSLYYIFLAVKARSFFFFSASNPKIENGGMFFESKWLIYQQLPTEYFPKTIFVHPTDSMDSILKHLELANMQYPLIAKPDRGERGWLVKKIHSEEELRRYKDSLRITFLIQSYVNAPCEFSVFYYRHPSMNQGTITSITFKKLLSITGNGTNTIKELIRKNDRAFLQYPHLKKESAINFDVVLERGKKLELVPYGNHALGAEFINYNHLISSNLVQVFDDISKRIDGFCYGRYDIRCTSIEDMLAGKNISILELNGAGAEPAHIYDPSFSFWKAQTVLAAHYKMMYDAAVEHHRRGIAFMTYPTFRNIVQLEKKYKKNQLCF